MALALLIIGTVGACGTPVTSARVSSPAPSASSLVTTVPYASPSPSSAASAARTPAAASPAPIVESLGLTCSLPVAVSNPIGAGRQDPDHGALIDFKTGRLAPDPAGGMRWRSPQSSLVYSAASPVLNGWAGGLTYDRAAGRWVPVDRGLISADGAQYTYGEPVTEGVNAPSEIHVVDVATGVDKVVLKSSGPDYPIAFRPEGIYVYRALYEVLPSGIWLLNPSTGQLTAVTSTGDWNHLGDGAAWGTLHPGGYGVPNSTVDRLDLKTGQTQEWLRVPDPQSVWVVGLDSGGRPIVLVSTLDNSPNRYLLVTSPGVTTPLFAASWGNPDPWVDQQGFWFAGQYGIYLFSGGKLHFVYANAPGMTIDSIAGACA